MPTRHADELAFGALAELRQFYLVDGSPNNSASAEQTSIDADELIPSPPAPCCKSRGRAAGIVLPSRNELLGDADDVVAPVACAVCREAIAFDRPLTRSSRFCE